MFRPPLEAGRVIPRTGEVERGAQPAPRCCEHAAVQQQKCGRQHQYQQRHDLDKTGHRLILPDA
jgi:hypothetical protein